MEVLSEGKNFKLVNEIELPGILDFLEQYLPDSLKFHQTLKTYLNDRVWNFHFYISKSWPEQPVLLHFPGITKSHNRNIYESFSVFCPRDQLYHLDLLEEEDVLLEWNSPLYLNFTHKLIIERIQEFYKMRGSIETLVLGEVFVLSHPLDEKLFSMREIMDCRESIQDGEIRQLSIEHAQTIYELYPAGNMESIEVFEKLLKQLPSYGIFSQTGELAAWMIQSYYGAMFSMQTRPEYRRKGYGIHLAKYLTKIVKDRGYIPYVIIRPDNNASKSLYAKLGFEKKFEMVRAVLHPKNSDCSNDTPPIP